MGQSFCTLCFFDYNRFIMFVESLAHIIISAISSFGYLGVFLAMVMESACIPLPSEVIMPFAGFLVFKGQMNLILVGVIGALGNLAGSLLAYWVGYKGGRPLVEKYGKYILLSIHDLNISEKWFKKYGKSTVFFTRMLPIVRTFISFPAGISKMPLKTFVVYTFLGALPWSLLLAYIGFKMGENWNTLGGYFHKADLAVGIVIIVGLIWYIQRHIKYLKKENL